MFGYNSKEELITTGGKGLYANEADRDRLGDLLLKDKSYSNVEKLFNRKDGTYFWGLMSGHLVYDDYTKEVYFDGAIRDITDQKKVERAPVVESND